MAARITSLLLLASATIAAPSPAPEPQWGGWGWGKVPSPGFGGHCPTPSNIPFNDDRLPDPFLFDNGQPVRTMSDWSCRRAQIAALIQGYEAGALPPRPPHVSATLTQINATMVNFTVTAGCGSNLIFWSNKIVYPSGTPPRNGWPLLFAYDGLSIPVPDGVVVLTYPNSLIAQQNSSPASRGVGLFYNLYGNVSASAMTAWVWGASRLIDALEQGPAARINTGRLGVTGCSRDGKGALMAGADETRFALTIPQESGSGGDTCWRLSKYEQDSGDVVQQATEIIGENVWFSTTFDQYVYNISVLPYDHHELAGMVAPRGLISYENTDFEWLSPLSSYGCMTAAHTIYTAMGVPDHHGFVEVGNHSHCHFPPYFEDSLFAFLDKFMLDEPNVDTNYFSTNGLFNGTVWDAKYWMNWTTPILSWL